MAATDTLKFSVVEGWEHLPKGFERRDVAGVRHGSGLQNRIV